MNRSSLRLLVGAALAVVVPAVVLDFTAGEERQLAGLTAAPFAWRSILLAHLAAALPLGLVAAAWVRSLPPLASSAPWLWVGLGCVTTGIGVMVCPWIGEGTARSELGAVPLLLLRSLLAFILVLPWVVAAVDPPAPRMGRRTGPSGVAFAVGLGLAIIPCGLYTEAVTAARTQETATLLTQRRLLKADRVLIGLRELGSKRPILTKSPAQMQELLADTLRTLREEADQPFPTFPSPTVQVGRAMVLVQLERLDEAATFLRPLVPGSVTATLMLAAVYNNQQQWAQSDALYTATLEKLLPLAPTEESARAGCRSAFDGLADNARMCHQPDRVEATLNRGLRELPQDAAHFHFLLGRHYRDTGRIGLALDHLGTAKRLDPTGLEKPADNLIGQIRTETPGCLTAGSR